VTLRTYRGTSVVRTLPLGRINAKQYAEDERTRCGYPPAALALGFDIQGSEVVGRELLVHLRLVNSSRGDLVVTGLRLSPGLTASGVRLPLRLMPSGPDHATRATLRVRMSDCEAFRATQLSNDTAEPYLRLTVRGRFVTETVDTWFNSENDGIPLTEIWATGAFRELCGMRTDY